MKLGVKSFIFYNFICRCEYKIIGLNGQRIDLIFETFRLENEEDFIHIYEERENDDWLLAVLTGEGIESKSILVCD